jgi:hypothetical protein
MPIRPCSQAHCSKADPEIYEVCVQNGLPAGYPVLTKDENGPCTCSCSCLAFGTPVQIDAAEYEAIEQIRVGDEVLAAGKDLQWSKQRVEFSQGTTGASRQPYTVLITYLDTAMAVTSDHVFLMANKMLKTADHLTVDDELLAPDGLPVPIKSVHIGDYTAGFHHIATKKALPNADLSGHLLNTNGVVSADYIVQIAMRSGELSTSFVTDHDKLPVVGSPEYVKKYGDDCLLPPKDAKHIDTAKSDSHDASNEKPVFISASKTRLLIPDDACRFISDAEAEAKKSDLMRRWNDPQSREWTEYLISHHRVFYPNVIYHLDWANDTVNAYAWIQNGVRNVAILGGLVRHMALELEGIGLVLAHELAHHYGGLPTFPHGLSCEGQADYYGVRTIMRRVWFGEQYITFTDLAIAQMANFFGVANDPTEPGGNAGCSHPAGACRIATYHAAVSLSGRPSCAG